MRPVLLVLAIGLVACRTTQTSQRAGPKNVALARADATRAWELWEAGRLLGLLVRFEETGDAARAFYSVRNREGQELGLVDLDGRAWRHRPRESRPEWLGTGTVLDGARRVLGGGASAELIEVELAALKDILSGVPTPPPR